MWTLQGVWNVANSRGESWSIEEVEQRVKNLEESTVFASDLDVYDLLNKHRDNSMGGELSFITGKNLIELSAKALNFIPRDAYFEMRSFCEDHTLHGKLGILYGMRNTGKTIILQQLAGHSETVAVSAYLTLRYRQCKVWELEDLIQQTVSKGYKFIYIDEVTWAEDFIDYSMGIADKFPMAKIILSGTDSLSFRIASQDALYHRTVFVRTTWMSYPEFNRILNSNILSYIHSGGVFWGTPQSPDDLRDYLETSIVDNIYNTINNIDKRHMGQECLFTLTKSQMYNIVYAICQSLVLENLLSKVNDLWGQVFAHRLKQALYSCNIRLKPLEYFDLRTDSYPYDVDSSEFNSSQVKVIVTYLQQMNFLTNLRLYTGQPRILHTLIFTQVGVEREFTRNVIMGVIQTRSMSDSDKYRVVEALDLHSEGSVLESIVSMSLLQHFANNESTIEISKFREFSGEFEIDTILNVLSGPLFLFEVKRGTTAKTDYAKHLSDPNKMSIIETVFGKTITRRIVLYRGETCSLRIGDVDVHYINIEKFLFNIDEYIVI